MQHHLLEYNDSVRTKFLLYLFKKLSKMYNVNVYNIVLDTPFDSHHSDSTSSSSTQPFVSSPIESPPSTTTSRSSSPPLLNSPFESNHSDSTSRSSSLPLQPFNSLFRSPLSSPPLQSFNSLFDSNHSDSPSRSPLSSLPILNSPFESNHSDLPSRSLSPPFVNSPIRTSSSLLYSGPYTSHREVQTSIQTSSSQSLNQIVFHGMIEQSPTTLEMSSLLPNFIDDPQYDEPQYILMSPESSSTSINWNQSNISYNTRSISPSVNISIADGTMGK